MTLKPGRNKRDVEAIAPLSPLQNGILFYSLSHLNDDPYFYQTSYTVEGLVNEDALERAWQWVVDRYEALRCDFRWGGTFSSCTDNLQDTSCGY